MITKKIALICAHPTGLNPGMLSVDLAGVQLMQDISSIEPVEWFLFNTEAHGSLAYQNQVFLSYNELGSIDQINNYDRIVFWGDFTHWLLYATKEWIPRFNARHQDSSAVEASKIWLQLFFLELRRELISKTIVFGSTFYGLNAQQLSIDPYITVMKEMYRNCLLAMPRDLYSTAFANHLALQNKAELGCDCAFLFNQARFLADADMSAPSQVDTKYSKSSYAVLALGRTKSSSLLAAFSYLVFKKLKVEVVHLSWLKNNGILGLRENLRFINGAQFVFTDIYHCAVTALRERKPTIVYGSSSLNPTHSLSDNKKEILMRQHLLGSNYFSTELIKDKMSDDHAVISLIDEIIELLRNEKALEIAGSLLHSHIDRCRTKLKKVLAVY